jgi:DNA-binding Lrp family transcriptional regulator
MDETDVALCRLLVYNSRTPYSELAKALDTSVQNVHRRVQALITSGSLANFNAAFSVLAVKGIWLMVHGRSGAPSVNKVLEDLKKVPGMDMAMISTGKYMYLTGVVRDPNRIGEFVASVTRTAKLSSPEIGVVQFPLPLPGNEPVVYPMDMKLVSALSKDSRRPVTELAEELGVAPRTVRRHIDRLNREMLVHFSLELYLNRTSDLFTALHLTVKKGQELEKAAMAMIKQLALREIITYNFGDRPEQFIVVFWSPTIGDLNETIADLEKSGMFEEVCPNLILDARYYDGVRALTPPVRGKVPK